MRFFKTVIAFFLIPALLGSSVPVPAQASRRAPLPVAPSVFLETALEVRDVVAANPDPADLHLVEVRSDVLHEAASADAPPPSDLPDPDEPEAAPAKGPTERTLLDRRIIAITDGISFIDSARPAWLEGELAPGAPPRNTSDPEAADELRWLRQTLGDNPGSPESPWQLHVFYHPHDKFIDSFGDKLRWGFHYVHKTTGQQVVLGNSEIMGRYKPLNLLSSAEHHRLRQTLLSDHHAANNPRWDSLRLLRATLQHPDLLESLLNDPQFDAAAYPQRRLALMALARLGAQDPAFLEHLRVFHQIASSGDLSVQLSPDVIDDLAGAVYSILPKPELPAEHTFLQKLRTWIASAVLRGLRGDPSGWDAISPDYSEQAPNLAAYTVKMAMLMRFIKFLKTYSDAHAIPGSDPARALLPEQIHRIGFMGAACAIEVRALAKLRHLLPFTGAKPGQGMAYENLEYFNYDFSSGMLQEARKAVSALLDKLGIPHDTFKSHYIQQDILRQKRLRMPDGSDMPDGHLDVLETGIFGSLGNTDDHLRMKAAMLTEMNRALRKGGYMILTVKSNTNLDQVAQGIAPFGFEVLSHRHTMGVNDAILDLLAPGDPKQDPNVKDKRDRIRQHLAGSGYLIAFKTHNLTTREADELPDRQLSETQKLRDLLWFDDATPKTKAGPKAAAAQKAAARTIQLGDLHYNNITSIDQLPSDEELDQNSRKADAKPRTDKEAEEERQLTTVLAQINNLPKVGRNLKPMPLATLKDIRKSPSKMQSLCHPFGLQNQIGQIRAILEKKGLLKDDKGPAKPDASTNGHVEKIAPNGAPVWVNELSEAMLASFQAVELNPRLWDRWEERFETGVRRLPPEVLAAAKKARALPANARIHDKRRALMDLELALNIYLLRGAGYALRVATVDPTGAGADLRISLAAIQSDSEDYSVESFDRPFRRTPYARLITAVDNPTGFDLPGYGKIRPNPKASQIPPFYQKLYVAAKRRMDEIERRATATPDSMMDSTARMAMLWFNNLTLGDPSQVSSLDPEAVDLEWLARHVALGLAEKAYADAAPREKDRLSRYSTPLTGLILPFAEQYVTETSPLRYRLETADPERLANVRDGPHYAANLALDVFGLLTSISESSDPEGVLFERLSLLCMDLVGDQVGVTEGSKIFYDLIASKVAPDLLVDGTLPLQGNALPDLGIRLSQLSVNEGPEALKVVARALLHENFTLHLEIHDRNVKIVHHEPVTPTKLGPVRLKRLAAEMSACFAAGHLTSAFLEFLHDRVEPVLGELPKSLSDQLEPLSHHAGPVTEHDRTSLNDFLAVFNQQYLDSKGCLLQPVNVEQDTMRLIGFEIDPDQSETFSIDGTDQHIKSYVRRGLLPAGFATPVYSVYHHGLVIQRDQALSAAENALQDISDWSQETAAVTRTGRARTYFLPGSTLAHSMMIGWYDKSYRAGNPTQFTPTHMAPQMTSIMRLGFLFREVAAVLSSVTDPSGPEFKNRFMRKETAVEPLIEDLPDDYFEGPLSPELGRELAARDLFVSLSTMDQAERPSSHLTFLLTRYLAKTKSTISLKDLNRMNVPFLALLSQEIMPEDPLKPSDFADFAGHQDSLVRFLEKLQKIDEEELRAIARDLLEDNFTKRFELDGHHVRVIDIPENRTPRMRHRLAARLGRFVGSAFENKKIDLEALDKLTRELAPVFGTFPDDLLESAMSLSETPKPDEPDRALALLHFVVDFNRLYLGPDHCVLTQSDPEKRTAPSASVSGFAPEQSLDYRLTIDGQAESVAVRSVRRTYQSEWTGGFVTSPQTGIQMNPAHVALNTRVAASDIGFWRDALANGDATAVAHRADIEQALRWWDGTFGQIRDPALQTADRAENERVNMLATYAAHRMAQNAYTLAAAEDPATAKKWLALTPAESRLAMARAFVDTQVLPRSEMSAWYERLLVRQSGMPWVEHDLSEGVVDVFSMLVTLLNIDQPSQYLGTTFMRTFVQSIAQGSAPSASRGFVMWLLARHFKPDLDIRPDDLLDNARAPRLVRELSSILVDKSEEELKGAALGALAANFKVGALLSDRDLTVMPVAQMSLGRALPWRDMLHIVISALGPAERLKEDLWNRCLPALRQHFGSRLPAVEIAAQAAITALDGEVYVRNWAFLAALNNNLLLGEKLAVGTPEHPDLWVLDPDQSRHWLWSETDDFFPSFVTLRAVGETRQASTPILPGAGMGFSLPGIRREEAESLKVFHSMRRFLEENRWKDRTGDVQAQTKYDFTEAVVASFRKAYGADPPLEAIAEAHLRIDRTRWLVDQTFGLREANNDQRERPREAAEFVNNNVRHGSHIWHLIRTRESESPLALNGTPEPGETDIAAVYAFANLTAMSDPANAQAVVSAIWTQFANALLYPGSSAVFFDQTLLMTLVAGKVMPQLLENDVLNLKDMKAVTALALHLQNLTPEELAALADAILDENYSERIVIGATDTIETRKASPAGASTPGAHLTNRLYGLTHRVFGQGFWDPAGWSELIPLFELHWGGTIPAELREAAGRLPLDRTLPERQRYDQLFEFINLLNRLYLHPHATTLLVEDDPHAPAPRWVVSFVKFDPTLSLPFRAEGFTAAFGLRYASEILRSNEGVIFTMGGGGERVFNLVASRRQFQSLRDNPVSFDEPEPTVEADKIGWMARREHALWGQVRFGAEADLQVALLREMRASQASEAAHLVAARMGVQAYRDAPSRQAAWDLVEPPTTPHYTAFADTYVPRDAPVRAEIANVRRISGAGAPPRGQAHAEAVACQEIFEILLGALEAPEPAADLSQGFMNFWSQVPTGHVNLGVARATFWRLLWVEMTGEPAADNLLTDHGPALRFSEYVRGLSAPEIRYMVRSILERNYNHRVVYEDGLPARVEPIPAEAAAQRMPSWAVTLLYETAMEASATFENAAEGSSFDLTKFRGRADRLAAAGWVLPPAAFEAAEALAALPAGRTVERGQAAERLIEIINAGLLEPRAHLFLAPSLDAQDPSPINLLRLAPGERERFTVHGMGNLWTFAVRDAVEMALWSPDMAYMIARPFEAAFRPGLIRTMAEQRMAQRAHSEQLLTGTPAPAQQFAAEEHVAWARHGFGVDDEEFIRRGREQERLHSFSYELAGELGRRALTASVAGPLEPMVGAAAVGFARMFLNPEGALGRGLASRNGGASEPAGLAGPEAELAMNLFRKLVALSQSDHPEMMLAGIFTDRFLRLLSQRTGGTDTEGFQESGLLHLLADAAGLNLQADLVQLRAAPDNLDAMGRVSRAFRGLSRDALQQTALRLLRENFFIGMRFEGHSIFVEPSANAPERVLRLLGGSA